MVNPLMIQRLERLRRAKGMTWAELGDSLDLSRTMLHFVRTGERGLSVKAAHRLALAEKEVGLPTPTDFEVTAFRNEVLAGKSKSMVMNDLALVNVEKRLHQISAEVRNLQNLQLSPLISWASAGAGGDYSDVEGFLNERIPTDCKDPNSFGLIVEGDSMEPECFAGDYIVLAPNSPVRNGDLVVARLMNDTGTLEGEVFFKYYHETGKGIRLSSKNPKYKPRNFVREDFRFIYPVHSVIRKYRK